MRSSSADMILLRAKVCWEFRCLVKVGKKVGWRCIASQEGEKEWSDNVVRQADKVVKVEVVVSRALCRGFEVEVEAGRTRRMF